MGSDLYRLTATEVVARVKAGEISVTQYASSIVERIEARDDTVEAWAYFNPEYVMEQARALDATPASERGPLHGVAIAVKDVIYTKGESQCDNILFPYKETDVSDMPTQFNSPIYANDAPKVDAGYVTPMYELHVRHILTSDIYL
jgi:hypothetical protein